MATGESGRSRKCREEAPDVTDQSRTERSAIGEFPGSPDSAVSSRSLEDFAEELRRRQKLEQQLWDELKSLRDSEERFRAISENAPAAIYVKDLDGRYVLANPLTCRALGREFHDVIGRTDHEILPADVADALLRHDQEVITTGQSIEREETLRIGDKELVYLSVKFPLRASDGQSAGVCGVSVDITDRKRAETAVRDSEQRFTQFMQRLPGLAWIKDIAGRYVYANDAAARAFRTTSAELYGKTDDDMFGQETARQFQENDRRAMASESGIQTFETLEHADGVVHHSIVSKFPIPGPDGKPSLVGGIAIDITEQKRTEEALRTSEAQFRLLADTIPQLAWMARPDGHIFWFNKRWYEYTGIDPQDAEGWGWQSVHDPRELPRVVAKWKAALAEGHGWEDTFPLRRHDGAMRWHLSRALPLKDESGKVVLWFGTNTDIAERKEAEATLQFLADASESLATLIDYKSTLQRLASLAVPNFADWCSLDMVEPDGSLCRMAIAHADPDKAEIAEKLRIRRRSTAAEGGDYRVLRSGRPELVTEVTNSWLAEVAGSDEELHGLRNLDFKSYICVPLGVRGEVFGLLAFATAESGRRYDPSHLAVAEDLAHRTTIAIENARLYQELREADRRKDEFLAMLAHELRNPLAPIRTGLDILAMEESSQTATVRLMQRQVEHLIRLVDDLLDVSRIMRGKVELRREPVELSAVVRQSLETVRGLITERSHRLVLSLPEEPVWLRADAVRLVQIVENLVSNACKYTDSGGTVTVTAQKQGGEVLIKVRDTGIGIEPEMLSKVFHLFLQSSRSLDRSEGGLGIGLTLVQNLVDMHGGTVSAYSEGIGKGAEFVVRLPAGNLHEADAQAAPPEMPADARRILVVDDNVAAARMLALWLEKSGSHEVDMAFDGRSALEKVEQFRPEIVLLDIGLPGMDGYQVARRIREHSEHDGIVLAALTGYGQADDRRRSAEAGFDEHLVKPPAIEDFQKLMVHPKLSQSPQRDASEPTADAASSLAPPTRHAELAKTFFARSTKPGRIDFDAQTAEYWRETIHELGNCAHVIGMAAKILEKSDNGADKGAVESILQQVGRSIAVVIDSLEYVRRNEGALPPRAEGEADTAT